MPRARTTAALTVALVLILAACAGSRPAPMLTVPDEESDVVQLAVPDDPTITFKVWFKAGSQDDPPGKEGLAYLSGEMLANASTRNNSLQQILEKLYPLAASYGVRVDREMTVLSGRTHRDNVEAYFSLFSDAYLAPAFQQDDFDRLKSDQLNALENALRYQQVEELGKAALFGFVFEGTRYAHPSLGTVEGLKSITLEDVRGFHARHYSRETVRFALGGGYNAALLRRFTATAESLPAQVAPAAPAIAATPVEGRRFVLVSKPDADASISFGHPLDVRRGDADFYPLWVANSWLGEHRNSSSRLYQVIREARGMNYGDYSYIEAFPEGGQRNVPPPHVGRRHQMFEVWIRTLPNEQAHFAIRAALHELRRLIDDGLTTEEFELTRAFLKKYRLHYADNTAARLGYALDDRFYGIADDGGHLERLRKRLDTLTVDEVNAAVRKHLSYENLKFAVVTGDAEGLARALVADAPSPMDYKGVSKPDTILAQDAVIAAFPLKVAADDVRIVPVDEVFQR